MSEELFRIIVVIGVLLATLAFLVQAGVVLGLYKAVRRMQNKVEPLMTRVEPVIDRIGPLLDKAGPVVDSFRPVAGKLSMVADRVQPLLESAHKMLEDNRPRVAEAVEQTAALSRSARLQVERVGDFLQDAGTRARDRLAQIDESVGNTVEQVGKAGGAMKRAVMTPVVQANGLAAGLSAAVSTIVHGGRKSSVDHATQDEEMFI